MANFVITATFVVPESEGATNENEAFSVAWGELTKLVSPVEFITIDSVDVEEEGE